MVASCQGGELSEWRVVRVARCQGAELSEWRVEKWRVVRWRVVRASIQGRCYRLCSSYFTLQLFFRCILSLRLDAFFGICIERGIFAYPSWPYSIKKKLWLTAYRPRPKLWSGFRSLFVDRFLWYFGFFCFRSNSTHHRFLLIEISKKLKFGGSYTVYGKSCMGSVCTDPTIFSINNLCCCHSIMWC
jgi:hypothetical protein